jgi:hypothetical protein
MDLHTLSAQINEALAEIKYLRAMVDTVPEKRRPLLTVSDICRDLAITVHTFKAEIMPTMPFLFRLHAKGQLRANPSDFERWKEQQKKKYC